VGAARRCGGKVWAHSPFPQFGKSLRSALPLLPDDRTQSASGPLLEAFEHTRCFAVAEVADPASQIAGQLLGHLLGAHTARPARQFPDSLLKAEHRFRRDPPLGCFRTREAEPQELPLPWPCHRTLLSVHLELKLGGDESREAAHHPFPGSPASNVNVAVVRIPRKPEFPSLQLSIELIEYDVTEQGRHHAAYTKGNFDRLGRRILRFGANLKESECCDEW
jgi:hypothetical protein